MQVILGADHAGFELKEKLKAALPEIQWQDCGPHNSESVDYPDYATLVADTLVANPTFRQTEDDWRNSRGTGLLQVMGLLICGTGQGMVMRANKFPQVRAALVYSSEIAEFARSHNHAQILCLGSRYCTLEQAVGWLKIFMTTPFAGDRHTRRIQKI